MAQNIFRIALVLLAAALVIAATYAMTPPFDPQQDEAAEVQQQKAPPPASQTALRQAISEAQSGIPNYDRAQKARTQLIANLSLLQRVVVATLGGVPVPTNQRLLAAARRQQQVLAKLGPVQATTYLGGGEGGLRRFDRYRVRFEHGTLLWFVVLGKDGRLVDYGFDQPGIPAPQNYIDNYAQFDVRERAMRMATQFGILLVVALFGRLALRLRV